jgi:hypothetical protein
VGDGKSSWAKPPVRDVPTITMRPSESTVAERARSEALPKEIVASPPVPKVVSGDPSAA